jgi:hypothetical protein
MGEAAFPTRDREAGNRGEGHGRAGVPLMAGPACASCGAPIEAHFVRGALLACTNPPRIYYHGKYLALPPMQARIMVLLVKFGSVSFEDLARLSKVKSLPGIFVATTALRKRLPAGVYIITRRRWGYGLEQR